MPPLEHFTHDFSESARPRGELAARADVILARLPEEADLEVLTGGMRPGTQLILLAGKDQAGALAGSGLDIADIWTLPMSEQEVRFRFLRWQRGYRLMKDYWETDQFLNTTINSSPNMIWYKDKNGLHEKVNDTFCAIVGKEKRLVEGRGHAYIWNVEHDDPACIESERKVMESGKTCASDEIVQSGDGKMLMTTYKSPLYDVDGNVMGTVGVAVNVTKERAFEQEVRTLELMFASLDCGVMSHSLDGTQVFSINRAALQLLGYKTRQEMLDDGFHMVAQSVEDEDKPKLRAAITGLKEVGDSANVEYRVRRKDGTRLHILGNVKLIEQNGELFYRRFLLDFTDQKEKEAQKDQALRYQEKMFQIFSTFLSDNIDDVYIMMDRDSRKTEFVTPNIERVLGVPWEAVIEDPAKLGRAKYYTGREMSFEELSALEPGMSLETMETERIHQKTGEHKRFRENISCISLQGVKKIIFYISDRTQEYRAQNTLTEALNMAQAANKAKSAFLSNVSHDIRTPMNAIIGFITLLREEANDPEQVLEYTQKISAASQHLLGLINDVLDMNKIESGSAVLNISELSLAEIIDEINAIIRPQAKAKKQTFTISTSSLNKEHLLGDKLRINQILINILSNAVKYTHEGGTIQMQVRELPQVEKHYSRIQFTIRDNGQGMSKEYQKIIFDPFTREQDSAWNQIQGTGLGMAITKNLVDLMRGSIHVDSDLGKGSTFTVELELRIQDREDDPHFWKRHSITRMIVADDDEEICHDIMKRMAGSGVDVRYATNGSQAVEMIRSARKMGWPYDLILLDWRMPGMDGLETARLIRKIHPEKIPILLFTAYDWSEIEEEAMEVGIEHFLPKPFFMSNFKDTIQRMRTKDQAVPMEKAQSVVSGKHVMVVDDIEVNRMILVKILATLGAVCDTAVDGQDALEKFEASQPGQYDLILMDIQMPRLNGYEAARAIRASAHPSARSIAIIAMTANAFVDDIRDALEAGMDAHIAKPIVLDQMKSTIGEVLEKKELSPN